MNTVLLYVIMCLVCQFKAPGGSFRNYSINVYILTKHAASIQEPQISDRLGISPKSNYKDCSFRNRDSSVKGTRLSVLILPKSQAGRKFEVLEAACLVRIYTLFYRVGQTSSF